MEYVDLIPIFEQMEINPVGIHKNSYLGEAGGLEMDSQEIIEFEAAVGDYFDITVPRKTFQRESSLEQITEMVEVLLKKQKESV